MKYILCLTFSVVFGLQLLCQSIAGTLSSNTIVCAGSNTGVLSVSGYTGSIVRWEYSYSIGGPWTPIIFTSPYYSYLNMVQSTYFKVIVQLTGYTEVSSNIVSVICDNQSIGGTILTNTYQCINSSATATLSNNNGTVLAWEYSTNNWIGTNTLITTNTLVATIPSLSAATQLRARIQNGVCPFAFSNTVTINPALASSGGSISGIQNVCAGSNASTLSLSNYTGLVQYWENSQSSGGPYNIISTNTNTLACFNLNQSTWYRAVVKNGTCQSDASTPFHISVDQLSGGGNITGTSSVCALFNSGTLQLIAQTGNVNHWQSSLNNGTTWNTISNSSTTLSFSNISSSTLYRSQVQNGVCPPALSSSFNVAVHSLPVVSFSVNSNCAKSTISFSNTGAGANTFQWDFGNGSSSSNTNPYYAYTSAGTYTVKLTAISMQNCIDSVKQSLTIHPLPSPNLFSNDTACFGNSFLFNNLSSISSGTISQWHFNFGDGSSVFGLNPVNHTYQNYGSYSVSLILFSNFSCKDSVSKTVQVYPKPHADFSASSVCKGSITVFNNLSIINNGILSSNWNFGNSTTSSLNQPTYSYVNAGIYNVNLIVASNHNCYDTVIKVVRVLEKPSIQVSCNNVCQGSPASFQYSITPLSNADSISIYFGDGAYSNSLSPTHVYATPGPFVFSLTVLTDSGCVSSLTKNISIYSKPIANFSANNACASDSIKFINTSFLSNGIMNYTWTFDPQNTSTNLSPNYVFHASGSYLVKLQAKSEFDCRDSISKAIIVFDSPQADFKFIDRCDGFPISFTNTSISHSGSVSSHLWQFGDNTMSTETNPIKEYLNKGKYSVSLVAINSNGCKDTIKKEINIFEGPIANFSMKNVCLNSICSFTNSSILSSGTYSSFWDFGDSLLSNMNSPEHVYSKSGYYSVKLKILTNNSCVDSIYKLVENYPLPKVITMEDTAIEKGFGIKLQVKGASKYTWYPSQGLNDSFIDNPFANPDSSIYYVVEGTDNVGCINRDTLKIIVKNNFLVIPYNMVTPDANGMNDTWIVKNIERYPENSVTIFDQWNQIVYKKEAYKNEWDGKNLRGEVLADATYYYILEFKNSAKIYTGYISLLRN